MDEAFVQAFDALYAVAYRAAQYVYWALILPFSNPSERLYIPWLISALLLAYVVYRVARKRQHEGRSFLAFLFPRDVWLSKSAILDYQFFVINKISQQFVHFGSIGLSGALVAGFVSSGLVWMFGQPAETFDGTTWEVRLAYSVFFLLAFDFGEYYGHYLLHRVKFLWEFHKVHHAATVLNPITNFRQHFVDDLVIGQVKGLALGLVIGVFLFLCGDSILPFTILSLPVVIFFYNLTAVLRHSHIWLSFGYRLNHIFSSPAMHQLHHSSEARHWDRNYGFALSIWDWMFGTIYVPREREEFRLGLSSKDEYEYSSVWRLYALPFKRVYELATGTAKESAKPMSVEAGSPAPNSNAESAIKGDSSS